ncbi:unnamed protein product [Cuscuta epithymum]|uniref:DUF3615 domain-containing protein n=1 Tax=Cuscuta epithymum TaxID=186058 RepID=A0AAV0ECG2_9ASTE|nr:unnamed protein product [Cuscuta epithymum]
MMAKRKRTSTLRQKKTKVNHMRAASKPSTQKRLTKIQRERMQFHEKFQKLSEFALRDYNDKHGTCLVFSSIFCYQSSPVRRGCTVGFHQRYKNWIHINFYARHPDANPSDKPLLLFAELYSGCPKEEEEHVLTTLSLVEPMGNESGCSRCTSCIRHPSHLFHGGFMHNCLMKGREDKDSIGRTRSVQKTTTQKQTQGFASLAKFALKDYNNKHKTKLEYVKAVKRHSFECMGLSMDFREKYTIWDHMNFVARRRNSDGSYEDLILFAEVYLGDDNKPVLATLLPLIEYFTLNESGCLYCPNTIRHPHRDCLYY